MSLSLSDRLITLSSDFDAKDYMSLLSTDSVLVLRNGKVTATQVGDALTTDLLALFGSGDAGCVFDIQDLSTVFQDVEKTIPATVGSRVAFVQSKANTGCNLYQPTATLRPYLRQEANGTYYLEANGSNWMYLGDTAAKSDFANICLCVAHRHSSNATIFMGKSHAPTHIDPYFRWCVYRSSQGTGKGFNVRLNGTAYDVADIYHNQDLVAVIDTHNGIIRCGGYQSAVAVTTLSYPNSVQARIFSNTVGGEVSTGRLYRLAILGRSVTNAERRIIERWAYAAIP